MYVRKKQILTGVLLIFIVLMQENFLYLIERNTILGLSITGMLLLAFNFKNIKNRNYQFKSIILLIVFTLIYGIIIAYFFYRQKIFLGFYGAHYIFIYFWYFFFVDYWDTQNKEEYIYFAKEFLISIGIFVCLIVILQGIFSNKTLLLNLHYSYRNGIRISGSYIGVPTLMLCLASELDKHKKKYVFGIIVTAYYLVIFNQSRSMILILVLVTIMAFFKKIISQKGKVSRLDLLFIVGGLISFMLSIKYLSSILNEVMYEMLSVHGNGGVRIEELSYYYEILKSNHFFGIGVMANQFELTKNIYGTSSYYYLEDIGMFSFIFKTGILGLFVTFSFIYKLFNITRVQNCRWKRFLGFIILLQIIIGFLTIQILDNKYSLIYYLIMLAMLSNNVIEDREVIDYENKLKNS